MPSPSTSPVPSPAPSSEGSDEDIELSFEWSIVNGVAVRYSKGSSTKSPRSTPPTPPQEPTPPAANAKLGSSQARRLSLSRSESMPSESLAPARPLQRAVSGPVSLASQLSTPAASSKAIAAPSSSGLTGTGRKLTGGAIRYAKSDAERPKVEIEERYKRDVGPLQRERVRRRQEEEKENHALWEQRSSPPQGGRPIASLPARQAYQSSYAYSSAARPLAINKKVAEMGKINEVEGSEGESDDGNHVSNRRTPSESQLNPRLHPQVGPSSQTSRPSSSLGVTQRARRITHEEKLRLDQEIASEEAPAQKPFASDSPEVADRYISSGSPTQVSLNGNGPPVRPGRHQRRDSDTVRSGAVAQYMNSNYYAQSNEVQEEPQPYQEQHEFPHYSRMSPTSQNGVSQGYASSSGPMHHRRSPTATEACAPSNSNNREYMRTWASTEKTAVDDFQFENAKSLNAQQLALQQQQQQQLQQQQQQQLPRQAIYVNKKPYARLDMIGRGGTSRVYRVMSQSNEIYAVKKVSLDKTDGESIKCYLNEIALLRRLKGNHRIISLIDSEVRNNPAGGRGSLMLVMECGEIDLARLIQEQIYNPMNMVWVAYYWQQILQAVQIIHDEKIVHSDLKPANFVLVKGQLKLIDFGIANAIANDTTNIQRDQTVGTVNYMSPEAIEVPEGMRKLKVGRPSDVWSLGCILYQMIYCHPPFQHLSMVQKMKAIPDPSYVIEFPSITVPPPRPKEETPKKDKKSKEAKETKDEPESDEKKEEGEEEKKEKEPDPTRPVRRDVIRTIRKCLIRNPKDRATIPNLLQDEWLAMKEPPRQRDHPPKLKEDETIINSFYMGQLLQYAIKCAKEGRVMDEEEQLVEGKRLVQELKQLHVKKPKAT